ncbi:class I tRNA ligase family protein [Patescibacteria group bacterium]
MTKNKFYITTSIAYTNANPHIGFALELIQADVLARYNKALGKNTFYLTGTDEHGKKVVKAAETAGKNSEEFTNEISEKFKFLAKALNVSNNDFIRTTDKNRHWPIVSKVWEKLEKNDDIYKKKYQGLYCVGCEAFITKKDLVNGKCRIHQKETEIIEEENYFFRLSKYQKNIEDAVKKDEIKIIPKERKKEILSFIKQGLEDVSFSRPRKDLKWGIPVPSDDSQVIYVWADALINYISALGYPDGEKFKKYWPADVHCLGKDILRFHSTIWPGILLSLGISLPKNILVHGFITSDGQKMSKSLGNIVNPFSLIEKYGKDAVRYFLLREIPSTQDGDFTYEKFQRRYNGDLAGGIGNLVSRTIALAKDFKPKISDSKFKNSIDKTKKEYKKSLDEFKFNESLISVWNLIGFCDKYIDEEKPWSFDSVQDKEKDEKVIGNLLSAISEIAELLKPFLPETSEKIFEQLKNNKSIPLFPRIRQKD